MSRNRATYIPEHKRRLLDANSAERMALVIPKGDDPLSYLQRFGWSLLKQDVWSAEARRNPLLFYRTGRPRSRALGEALQYLPWLLLAAAEYTPLLVVKPPDGAPVLLMLVVAEVFFVPFFFLTFFYVQLWQRLRRFYGNGGWESLGATPLSAASLATAPVVPVVSMHLALNLLTGVALGGFLLHYFLEPISTEPAGNGALMLLLLGLIFMRCFVYFCLMESATVIALDEFFRHGDGPGAVLRGLRRVFRPVFLLLLIPGILMVPLSAVFALTAGMPGFREFYMIVCSCGLIFGPLPILVLILGARMEARTNSLLKELLSQRDQWLTGE